MDKTQSDQVFAALKATAASVLNVVEASQTDDDKVYETIQATTEYLRNIERINADILNPI